MIIMISYRRADSAPITGRIYDRLCARFGSDGVFMDIDSIPIGIDYRTHVDDSLRNCDVLLTVIGRRWLGEGKVGERRIDDPTDLVRLEVAQALKRDIRVIPLLVEDCEIPPIDQLPEDLHGLRFRNALRIDSGIDFHHHVDRLCTAIEMIAGRATPPPPKVARVTTGKTFEPTVTSLEKTSPPVPGEPAADGKKRRSIALITAIILLLAGVAGVSTWLIIKRQKTPEVADNVPVLNTPLPLALQQQPRNTPLVSTPPPVALQEQPHLEPSRSVQATPPPENITITKSPPVPEVTPEPSRPVQATPPPQDMGVTKPPPVPEATPPEPSRPSKEATNIMTLNMNRELSGSYDQNRRSVPFSFQSVQKNGSTRFHGVITEPYTNFGVAKNNRVWADASGEITQTSSGIRIRFTKTYRYFKNSAVIYQGEWNPSTGEITGRWTLSEPPGTSGKFKMK